jgi:hypothetical protein
VSLLDQRFELAGAYFLPAGSVDWDRHAWQPEDALLFPLRDSDGELIGVLSVDEPESGLRPSAGDPLGPLVDRGPPHPGARVRGRQSRPRAAGRGAAQRRAPLPVAGRAPAGGRLPVRAQDRGALGLRQPPDRVDARLQPGGVGRQPAAVARAHPSRRPRGGARRG